MSINPSQITKNAKNNLLEQIKADIVANNVCPDLAQAAKNLVMGVGDPDAQVMFVGEAPGKKEDIAGEPFIGAAGKILDQALEAAGVKRVNVYITNIVKYRPPNNRDPLTQEKRAFWPYLLQEIDIVKPVLVVPLGRHAMEYFLPKAKITATRGKVHKQAITAENNTQEILVMPTYHPAATIYNRQLRDVFMQDIKNIADNIN